MLTALMTLTIDRAKAQTTNQPRFEDHEKRIVETPERGRPEVTCMRDIT